VYVTTICVMTFSFSTRRHERCCSPQSDITLAFRRTDPFLAVQFHVLCKEHDISVCASGHKQAHFPKRCVLFNIRTVKCNIRSSISLDLKETYSGSFNKKMFLSFINMACTFFYVHGTVHP